MNPITLSILLGFNAGADNLVAGLLHLPDQVDAREAAVPSDEDPLHGGGSIPVPHG